MTTDPNDRRRAAHVRDVAPIEMARLLRAMLGLDAHRPLPEERAAGPWIAWAIVGLALFTGPKLPSLRAVIATAKRVIVALATLRHDSISRSSVVLGVSRRTLREAMKAAELHPWRRGPDDERRAARGHRGQHPYTVVGHLKNNPKMGTENRSVQTSSEKTPG